MEVNKEERLLIEAARAMKEYPVNILLWYSVAMEDEINSLKKRRKKAEWPNDIMMNNCSYKMRLAQKYMQEMNKKEGESES